MANEITGRQTHKEEAERIWRQNKTRVLALLLNGRRPSPLSLSSAGRCCRSHRSVYCIYKNILALVESIRSFSETDLCAIVYSSFKETERPNAKKTKRIKKVYPVAIFLFQGAQQQQRSDSISYLPNSGSFSFRYLFAFDSLSFSLFKHLMLLHLVLSLLPSFPEERRHDGVETPNSSIKTDSRFAWYWCEQWCY